MRKPIKENILNYFIDNFQPTLVDKEAEKEEMKKDIELARKEMKKNRFFRNLRKTLQD